MNTIKLIENQPLDLEKIIACVSDESAGAISTFIGTTRNHFNGKLVVSLNYEAYHAMAEKEMFKICDEIRDKWNVVGIAIFHRLGQVAVKEASVMIAISSTHRKESLQAVEYAINRLKEIVPIWKEEQYEDESKVWKENAEWKLHKDQSIS